MPSLEESRVGVRNLDWLPRNNRTRIPAEVFFRAGLGYPALDAAALYRDHWGEIRGALAMHRSSGLMVMALDSQQGLLGYVWTRVSRDRTRSLLVGRHARCDLSVPDDRGEISLRHLTILARGHDDGSVRLRVFDLRTGVAFADEGGRLLTAVEANGSMFIRLGSVALALLVSEDGELPEQPDEAYARIPPRQLIDGRTELMPNAGRALNAPSPGNMSTQVSAVRGPLRLADDLTEAGDPSVGTLDLATQELGVSVAIGHAALERGVLIGRYRRCELGPELCRDDQLSRVHCLLVADGEDVLLVDTASTNGTRIKKQRTRIAALGETVRAVLAGRLGLRWRGLVIADS